MNSGTILYTAVAGVCIGLGLALDGFVSFTVAIVFLFVSFAAIVVSLVTRIKVILFVAIMCGGIALGIIRADMFVRNFNSQTVFSFVSDKSVEVEGIVSADPDVRPNATHVQVTVSAIGGHPARGELVAYFPPEQKLSYNDLVQLRGVLQTPAPFLADTGNAFDYPHYLEVKNISSVLNGAEVLNVQPGHWSLFGSLYRMRKIFDASIARLYPSPESTLLQGMLFGERRALPAQLQQLLASVGLIHIVILAGYALTLVAQAIGGFANFLPRKYQLPLVAILLIVYVAMTGAAATTVRASIMAIIAMIARMNGRASLALRSLAVALAAMALYNPPILLWDSGFIVSALATFGLITLGGSLEKLLHFIPTKLKLREITTSTLAVQIFALPALLYYTGNLSLIAILANLLALPALPYAMLFGFLSAFLNIIHPALAFIPMLITHALVQYLLVIATVAASVPYGFTTVLSFPGWGALLIYIPLSLLALNEYRYHQSHDREAHHRAPPPIGVE